MRDDPHPSDRDRPSTSPDPAPDADRTDGNGQQNVEDRPNLGIVTPDDYPEQQ